MTTTDPATESSSLGAALKAELFGPPRRPRVAQYAVVAFGLLLLASLVIPSVTAVDAMPESSLTMVGLMVLLGFAELIDPQRRTLINTLRIGGAVVALLGFVLRFV